MSKTLHGRATVFGVDGTIAFGGLATTESDIQTMSISDEFDTAEVRDRFNEVMGVAAMNPRQSLTVEITISQAPGAGQSIATAKANYELPTQMAIVTLADFGVPEIDGTWNYAGGGTVSIGSDQYWRISLPLRRNNGAALQPVGA